MTKIIGLTGSIATGKSTVATLFNNDGIPVVDADQIARQVVEPDRDAYKQIIKTFGHDLLKADQTLDRKKLAKLIFNDPIKRQALNQIVHPAITDAIIAERDALIKQQPHLIVLDIPLLYENELTHLVDQVIVVYTPVDVQVKRLMKRNQLTKQEAEARINSQISIELKAQWANFVIDNSGALEQTEHQYDQIIGQLKV
ncbi:dephospho-CoA kinase [Amphibacillus sediminis]|uniref:dephospho-CoA kinase n=1 Tax=Amphibacillus sediminis TaxID=360185 RepID=UPI000834F1F9|nr:dephospho-CoA kinase [Amphibacillus sediminis]